MEILGKILPEEKRDKKTIYKLIGVLVGGVLLLILSSTLKSPDLKPSSELGQQSLGADQKARADTQPIDSYEVQMEKRLKSILKKMQGVGEVEVMITTTYGKEIILAEDLTSHGSSTTEEDKEGGTREVNSFDDQKKIVMKNHNVAAGNEPVVIKEKQPVIQGALVIAQGAGNSHVKQSITEATQILLGIPAHRVTVHQLQTLK